MKISNSSKQRQGGVAVIVMLALLSIMFACITVNIRSLNQLDRELKLLEHHQTRRLARITATNAPTLLPTAPRTSP